LNEFGEYRGEYKKETDMALTARKGKTVSIAGRARGPWDSSLEQLFDWDPGWAETCVQMTTNPWARGILPRKTVALISIALSAACTNLNHEGTRLHIHAALEAGATREEILMVLKMASLLSIHSCSVGAPILLEEAREAGVELPQRAVDGEPTLACDAMRASGQWNRAWDPFFELDPVWTDQFMAAGISIYASGLMPPKLVELLSIAFDASFTHMYAPGMRRHIKAALRLGATVEEIMEVLKLCVAHGVQACNLGVPILAEELNEFERRKRFKTSPVGKFEPGHKSTR
jgi:alkylhydroperoxidase/carboxymuconolactone decarboxylase family protein YurZ